MGNTSGLITRGLGKLQKLLTRGFGTSKKIIKDFPPKVTETKEYIFDIVCPVKKQKIIELNIYTQLKVIVSKKMILKSQVNKNTEKSFELKSEIDSDKLFDIIDAI